MAMCTCASCFGTTYKSRVATSGVAVGSGCFDHTGVSLHGRATQSHPATGCGMRGLRLKSEHVSYHQCSVTVDNAGCAP
jgi:hypothetical protein